MLCFYGLGFIACFFSTLFSLFFFTNETAVGSLTRLSSSLVLCLFFVCFLHLVPAPLWIQKHPKRKVRSRLSVLIATAKHYQSFIHCSFCQHKAICFIRILCLFTLEDIPKHVCNLLLLSDFTSFTHFLCNISV